MHDQPAIQIRNKKWSDFETETNSIMLTVQWHHYVIVLRGIWSVDYVELVGIIIGLLHAILLLLHGHTK